LAQEEERMSDKLAGDHLNVIVDGYDLTGDHNQLVLDDQRQTYDVTAFGDSVRHMIAGRRQITLGHMGYLNPDVARSHPVLRGMSVANAVSVLVGNNAIPTEGDIAYSMGIRQGRYQTMARTGSYIPFSATFATHGELGGWGRILKTATSFTNSFNGTALDNGAATSNGRAGYLHIVQASAGDTYAFTLEGSTTGAFAGEQTTLGSFTLNAATLTSERLPLSGTLPRYVRLKAVRTGSAGNSVRIISTLIRL